MTLVCQSVALLELTQCSNITAREKKQQMLRAKNQSRLAPWRLVSTSDCMAYCFWKRLQCQACQAGDTEITQTHTQKSICEQNQLKTVCEICPKHMGGSGGGHLHCYVPSSGLRFLQMLTEVDTFCYLWSLYSSSSLLRSWLYKLSLFSRHLSISFNLFKWHISRF